MRQVKFGFVIFLLVFCVIAGVFFITIKTSKKARVMASNSTSIVTDESQWNAGTLNNIAVDPSGSIDIDDMTPSGTLVDTTGSTVTSTCSSGTKQNAIDDDINTEWGPNLSMGPTCYWTIQLASQVRLASYHLDYYAYTGINVYSSTNGTDWTKQNDTIILSLPAPGKYSTDRDVLVETDALYFRIEEPNGAPYEVGVDVWELDLYQAGSATATHTSAATQITDTNFYQWQTFSPTYTEPANTDISFKFRTSTDSTNWTAWTASQTVASGGSLDISGLVTSSTGDPGSETFYKYIQVETTLVSTDGIATPTLSDYTIGYHTNVKPTTPTPGSVTIGS